MSLPPTEFAERLLRWFDEHGRHNLPWQQHITPYRVWISEVMLQQTQVAAVIPYFARFMARFPSVDTLAEAPLDEVLHLWTGLGYYARARNLQACAKAIMASGGTFPLDLDALIALPGIGRSTAGAILAIATNRRHAILDGNVKRVLSRIFGIAGDPGNAAVIAALWAKAEACTPELRVAAYTQAIMDMGATLCTRRRPACTVCPMSSGCTAAIEGRQADLPGRKKKRLRPARETTLLIAETGNDCASSVLVERRPLTGIWGGLWAPPAFDSEQAALEWCAKEIGDPEQPRSLPPIDHAFTHYDLRIHAVRVWCRPQARVAEGSERQWYALQDSPRIGLPQPIARLFERLRNPTDT